MQKYGLVILMTCMLAACRAESPPADETVSHDLSPTSEVQSGNSEWNRYTNHALGVSIQFPKFVLESSHYDPEGENPTVPVRIMEKGEVVIFSRGYSLDLYSLGASGSYVRVEEDLSIRSPYYSNAYVNDPNYLSYPYAIYLAKGENIDDVRSFVKRAYGNGCIVDEERASSYYEGSSGSPRRMTFSIEPDVPDCPGYSPKGDIVFWYEDEHVIVGIQPRAGNFRKPYLVDLSKDFTDYNILSTLWVHQ